MSYYKIGGLHYVYIGRFGFCWFWQRPRQNEVTTPRSTPRGTGHV